MRKAFISGCKRAREVRGEEENRDQGEERVEVVEEQRERAKRAGRLWLGVGGC